MPESPEESVDAVASRVVEEVGVQCKENFGVDLEDDCARPFVSNVEGAGAQIMAL